MKFETIIEKETITLVDYKLPKNVREILKDKYVDTIFVGGDGVLHLRLTE